MTAPEEARLIMKGWLQNQSQLSLVGEVGSLAVAVRCHIGLISDELIGLVTTDGGKVTIDVSAPGVEFRYSQLREFPAIGEKVALTPEQQFAEGLTFFLPRPVVDGDDEDSDVLHLSELIEP